MSFWRKTPFAARGTLKSIDENLSRIADALEYVVSANFGYRVRPVQADTAGEEPECLYTDEEVQAVAAYEAEIRAAEGKLPREE